jgi:large subunit ribosomal protein L18
VRRKLRVRNALRKKAAGRPRLSVFRSGKHMYAQIIDDLEGRTIAHASTLDKDIGKLKNSGTKEAAKKVGELIAKRAKSAKIDQVVFDRGGYLYHGRVQALADGAREGGLKF